MLTNETLLTEKQKFNGSVLYRKTFCTPGLNYHRRPCTQPLLYNLRITRRKTLRICWIAHREIDYLKDHVVFFLY